MEKGVPWKNLENDGQERIIVKRFRELAEEEKQAGIQGQWQLESPARVYLEQVKCCHDTDCNERMMRKERLHCPGRWRLGRILEHFQEGNESHGMGL